MEKYTKFAFVALIFSALVLSGCGNQKTNQEYSGQAGPESAQETNQEENQSIGDKMKDSLYGLVTSGAGMKCTVNDPESGEMTMYTKGEKVKVEGFSYSSQEGQPSEPGSMINDGEWVYTWSGKEGIKFNLEEMEEMSQDEESQAQNESQDNASDWKSWVKEMEDEGVEYECSPAVLSDADFIPPSDVTFQDWGEMMKGLMLRSEEMQERYNMQNAPQ